MLHVAYSSDTSSTYCKFCAGLNPNFGKFSSPPLPPKNSQHSPVADIGRWTSCFIKHYPLLPRTMKCYKDHSSSLISTASSAAEHFNYYEIPTYLQQVMKGLFLSLRRRVWFTGHHQSYTLKYPLIFINFIIKFKTNISQNKINPLDSQSCTPLTNGRRTIITTGYASRKEKFPLLNLNYPETIII